MSPDIALMKYSVALRNTVYHRCGLVNFTGSFSDPTMAEYEWDDLRYGLAVATAPRVRASTGIVAEALRKYRPLHEGEQPH